MVFSPGASWRKNLSDLGPAIGGFWALSAGLLAYFAAVDGIHRQEVQRRREVAAACLAEIQVVWAKLAEMNVIDSLQNSSRNIREGNQQIKDSNYKLNALVYRGNIGDSWLCLQSQHPEAFGVLPLETAKVVTNHYSRVRNLVGRLNWMTSENFSSNRYHEALGRQDSTEKELRALEIERGGIVSELKRLSS